MMSMCIYKTLIVGVSCLLMENRTVADTVNSNVSAKGSPLLTAYLCDAELMTQIPGDHFHVARKDGAIEAVRYILGSARYNAAYRETVCLTARSDKNAEGKGKGSLDLALTLTPTSLYAEDKPYPRLAKLSLTVVLSCDGDDRRSDTLYEGAFLDVSVTTEWNMRQGEECQIKLLWQETSGDLRSWGGTPTSITGFLRVL